LCEPAVDVKAEGGVGQGGQGALAIAVRHAA
jgi:hypothetical protein